VRKPARRGIDEDGRGQDIGAVPEDRLPAVPVVRVDVQQGDATNACVTEALGGDGGVVQIARAAVGGAG
jgi:hypothetical protein